jgi:hypothetical protein
MLDMITDLMVAQALHVAARLGIADELTGGPLSPDEIARRLDADPDAVSRLLRALASRGVFASDSRGRYRLNPLAETLCSDAPVSMRQYAMFFGSPEHWGHWAHLLDAVRTGETAVQTQYGTDVFALFEARPEYGAVFNGAMTTLSDMVREPVLAAYDFSRYTTIVDVGGGHGSLLAGILERTPSARGVLYDLPDVVAEASGVLATVSERCRVEGGSFFDSVPAGADAYVLKSIVHDWTEEKALVILRHIRESIAPDGRLLLIELVIPEGDGMHPGKFIDLEMLLVAGGRERTEEEYRELLAKAGFALVTVIPTASPMSVLECAPI